MTVTFEQNVQTVTFESATTPGIVWQTTVGGTGTEIPARRLLPVNIGTPGQIPAVNAEGTVTEYVDAQAGGGNIDGGDANSIYGGTDPIDGGGA